MLQWHPFEPTKKEPMQKPIKPTDPVKKHFFMFACQVAFKATETAIGSVLVNVALHSEEKNLRARDLARAQQGAQMNFFKKFGDAPPEVVDVIMTNVTYLGHMTQEEFNEPPPKTELREAANAVFKEATGASD
jgi:hypothetical protein